MGPEHWRKLKELFDQALDVSPVELPAFIDRNCGDDESLRKELLSLLKADQRVASFLDSPVAEWQGQNAGQGLETGIRDADGMEVLRRLIPDVPTPPGLFAIQRSDCSLELQPGAIFGSRFRVLRLCGEGGFGTVYHAEDLKLGQDVALKLLLLEPQADTHPVKRFANEVRMAREVTHPNVCRVFDIGEANGIHFLSMEYIEGLSLEAWLEQNPQPPIEQALSFALQLCSGLHAAHRRGILHRDLKPSNLMVDQQGWLHITDFGLAMLTDKVTGPEALNGTPAYMSPEQHSGLEASVRSDLYSLGLIFYRLLTGREAFAGTSREELADWHRHSLPPKPSELGFNIPDRIEAIAMACLAKDPGQRPSSVAEVARALGAGIELRALTVLHSPVADEATPERERLETLLPELAGKHLGRPVADADTCWLFDRPIQAVRFALDCQDKMPEGLKLRVAVNFAEAQFELLTGLPDLVSINEEDIDVTANLAKAAEAGQILLTRGVFDLARQQHFGLEKLQWVAHGSYELSSCPRLLDLCEVGREQGAPLRPPRESKRLRRCLVQESVGGWRPSQGLEFPHRPGWTLERRLGEGGYGEVWLAVNTSTGVKRSFKFCFDAARLRSLQRETSLFRLLKEVLGERGDIVRVLDWNLKEAPYFIESEYSEGGSLLDWAEQQGGLDSIALDRRLKIVSQIASALAAAHSVGVLHKDIKPGNILILPSPDGQEVRAQLSDFGLGLVTENARFADAGITALGFTDPTDSSLNSEPTGGTRLYMAPELLEGKAATVQADIYALGVLLYQIIVGDFGRALATGWERDVHDELLIEDIASAIDGVPERRLAGVQQLADRIRTLERRRENRRLRNLEQEEVKKAKVALAKSRQKRNVFAIAALVFLVLASGMLFHAQRIAREAETTEAALSIIEKLFKGIDPSESQETLNSMGRIFDEEFRRLQPSLGTNPKVLGRVFHSAAKLFGNLRFYEKAEGNYRKALIAREEAYGRRSRPYVEALNALAEIQFLRGDFSGTESRLADAFSIAEEFGKDGRDLFAESLEIRARLLYQQGKFELAEESFETCLAIRLDLFGEDHSMIPETQVKYATFLNQVGQYGRAELQLAAALNHQVRIFGRESVKLTPTLDSLGETIQNLRNYVEPEEFFERSLHIKRRTFGDQSSHVADSLHRLARLQNLQGDFASAERNLEEALSINKAVYGENHSTVGESYSALGDVYYHQRQYDKALSLYKKNCDIFDWEYGSSHDWSVSCQVMLARFYTKQGNYRESESILRNAEQVLHKNGRLKGTGFNRAWMLQEWARLDLARNHLAQAKSAVEEAMKMLREANADESNLVSFLFLYSEVLVERKDFFEAEEIIRKILKIYHLKSHPRHPRIAYVLKDLASVLLNVGRLEEAEAAARSATEILQESLPAKSWREALASHVLVKVLVRKNDYTEAEKVLLDARSKIVDQLGEGSPLAVLNGELLVDLKSAQESDLSR